MTRLEIRCTECTLFGEWESFKRDDSAESIEVCPSCGNEDVAVDEALEVFEVTLIDDGGSIPVDVDRPEGPLTPRNW